MFKTDADGAKLEPIEEVIIDVDEGFTGVVVQKLSERKGELLEMRPSGGGRQRMVFHVPTRGLLGYQASCCPTHAARSYEQVVPQLRALQRRDRRAPHGRADLEHAGEAAAYAIFNLQDRGPFMIGAQTRVYEGMMSASTRATTTSKSMSSKAKS